MQTTKRYNICHWSLLIGILLLGATQMMAVDYKNSYRSEYRVQSTEYRQATAPSATFRSTSTYSKQWDQDAQQSMLNADGTINGNAYLTSGPRRVGGTTPGGGTNGPGTPGTNPDKEDQQPLGDAVLPLLIMALTFIAMRRYRLHKA